MQVIAVFGASSGLGAAIAEHFHLRGFRVIAVARNPEKNLRLSELGIEAIRCDATARDDVEEVVSSLPKDAIVVSSMGSYTAAIPVDYLGHRNLIDALQEHEVKRFLLVTSLGCGDSWQYLSEAARKGFGAVVREKSLAEAWLTSSSLDYTILRPGGLKNGDVSNCAELSQNVEVHGVVTRAEVARVIYSLSLDNESVGQIYACVDPALSY
ncbi:SDR family NAD(P)-dependent oxidoreductase [Vibrio sonorensis]|uniref:SDR family NAD(P)-dependent oxidoreductase n=1 Tax=Vibrio sonorensis TaxID=1004316 RepID=UPI0008DA351F|nr:SDR family NAD(P)-dependent oxidoreductase [Vibrio sonorensis]